MAHNAAVRLEQRPAHRIRRQLHPSAALNLALPEALRLAADGAQDPAWKRDGRRLAEHIRQGRSLEEGLRRQRNLPASLYPLMRWGVNNDRLAEALNVAGGVLEERLEIRAQMLRVILPPVLLMLTGVWLLVLVLGLYGPMLGLIGGLT